VNRLIIICLFSFRLKYYGDNTYEFDGFTTSVKAKTEDIELLCTPNTGMMNNLIYKKKKLCFFVSLGGQPSLNFHDANYIFTQIAKLFCLMFNHEQTERSIQNESNRKKKKKILF